MEKENRAVKATMTITAIIIVSKAVGFIREMVFAAYFGQGIESDAYSAAYSILSIFIMLFSAAISSTFIPIYTRTKIEQGKNQANFYASNILTLYMVAAAAASVLGYFFAPQLCALIWKNAENIDLLISLTRIMMPSLIFWAISGVLTNVLNANKHFIPEQLIGFALSACVMIACTVIGTIESVAIATAITAAVQVVILLPFARLDMSYKPRLDLRSKKVKRTFILAIPALISMAFDELNHITDTVFGSAMSVGTVTALRKSYTLVQTALGVLIVPITTVMFSQLSALVARQKMNEMKDTVKRAVEVITFVTLPIIVVCVINSTDIIAVFYQRGNYTAADSAFAAPVFACYIVGIFAFGLRNFLTRVFYSLQMTRLPMFVGILSVIVNIVLDMFFKDTLGAPGLTLATSISSLLSAVLMLLAVRKRLGKLNARDSAMEYLKIIIAAVACVFVAYCMTFVFEIEGTNFLANLSRLLISALPAIGVYLLCTYLMKVRAAKTVAAGFKRRGKK